MLTGWLTALEAWPVAAALRTSIYAYPLVNATHIFGLALLIGSILPIDLRLLGVFRSIPIGSFVPVLTRFAATGLAIAIISGFLLFSVNPIEYAENPAFLTKIALVAIGIANALALRFTTAWSEALHWNHPRPALRAPALLSLILWPTALVAGRWIGFL